MSQQSDRGATTLSWRAFPANQRRGQAALALIVVVLIAALVFVLLRYGGTGSAGRGMTSAQCALWACLSALALLLSLHRFFFPSRYEIDDEGLTYRHLFGRERYRWEDFHRFLLDEKGGFLMTTPRRPRLRPLQGVHLLFDGAREEAVRLIASHVGRRGEA